MEEYSIELRQFTVFGTNKHNYFVLRAPDGTVLAELHGGKAFRPNEQHDPLDQDRAYSGIDESSSSGQQVKAQLLVKHYTKHSHERLLSGGFGTYFRADDPSQTVFSGSMIDVLGAWGRGVAVVDSLNALDQDYDKTGPNSNTTNSILNYVMGIGAPETLPNTESVPMGGEHADGSGGQETYTAIGYNADWVSEEQAAQMLSANSGPGKFIIELGPDATYDDLSTLISPIYNLPPAVLRAFNDKKPLTGNSEIELPESSKTITVGQGSLILEASFSYELVRTSNDDFYLVKIQPDHNRPAGVLTIVDENGTVLPQDGHFSFSEGDFLHINQNNKLQLLDSNTNTWSQEFDTASLTILDRWAELTE